LIILTVAFLTSVLSAQWTPEEMMKVKGVGSVLPSPDGKRVLFTVTEPVMTEDKSEYLTQVWMAAADGSGAVQFTFGDKSSTNPQWSPCGKWIAFASSRSGKNNVWLIRADGGEAERLTDVKSGVGSFAWAPDGRSIAFAMADPANDKEEKDQKARNDARVVGEGHKMSHLWVIPVAKDAAGKREARRLTEGAFTVNGWDWSPDGKSIIFAHQPTPVADDWTRSDISIVDVAAAAVKPFAVTGAAEADPLYSPDGTWVAFTASKVPPTWAGASRVVLAPSAGGPARPLAPTFDEQPDLVGWSADGKSIYYNETQGTEGRLGYLPVDGGAPKVLNPDEDGVLNATLNASRTAFGLSAQGWDRPAEAYVTGVEAWSPRQISKVNSDAPKHPLGKTEIVRWKSKDGLEVEGLLTYPVGYEKGKRYPLILNVHGGPAGVFVRSFIANRGTYPIAAFAAQGWAVLRCNIRGSSGYGAKFRHANLKDWGGKDYQDLMAGVDHVIALGVADPNRLGVCGWSYGGYMTSWIITQTKRFKAASIGAPVTNLMSFTGTADIPSFIPDYFGAEFWDNPAIYRAHSAMFNIKGAATPTMIQQGEQDVRVPIQQGYELYNALKRQGTTVKMVAYPRQPHGLQEPRLLLDAAGRNIEWFMTHLK
jgi:dipeptidyl aminopeptidase/acylaminoacyl peptidase